MSNFLADAPKIASKEPIEASGHIWIYECSTDRHFSRQEKCAPKFSDLKSNKGDNSLALAYMEFLAFIVSVITMVIMVISMKLLASFICVILALVYMKVCASFFCVILMKC